jgi:hypothetical protein
VCLTSLLWFSFDVSDASECFIPVTLRHAFVSNHVLFICTMHQVTIVFLYGGYYILFLLFFYCICAVTFAEYVAFISSGVVPALFGHTRFACI